MNKEQFTGEVLAAEKSMYCVAKTILGRNEDCADAMQNAILNAYRKLDSLKEEKYFKTWLTRILINECYAMLRNRKTIISYEEYMENGAEGYASNYYDEPECSPVFQEMQALNEKYRIPFVLHYIEGYSIREIGRMLGKSEASIKMRLNRGRKILRERLQSEYRCAGSIN